MLILLGHLDHLDHLDYLDHLDHHDSLDLPGQDEQSSGDRVLPLGTVWHWLPVGESGHKMGGQ